MKYQVYWDNGNGACGTFPNVFETEEEAQSFADNWVAEMSGEADPDGDQPSAEVIEVEETPMPDEEELFRKEDWER